MRRAGSPCECCGETGTVTIVTATTPLGGICLSTCPRCAAADVAPPVSVGPAGRFVLQHCEHLGIEPDQMAAQLATEKDDQSSAPRVCGLHRHGPRFTVRDYRCLAAEHADYAPTAGPIP